MKKIKHEFFDLMWKDSYTGEDVDVQAVLDGLNTNRDGDAEEQRWLHQRRGRGEARTRSSPKADKQSDAQDKSDIEGAK